MRSQLQGGAPQSGLEAESGAHRGHGGDALTRLEPWG
jgi:hypothetical protein